MKRSLRNAAVLIMSSPAIAAVYALALIRGKEQAIRLVGPFVTSAAKASLRFWVPEIGNASQFDVFRKAIRNNIKRWKPLYDVTIVDDSPDMFKINVANCPFCEVFPIVGLKDMNEYFCRADWEIAGDNRGKWIFERTHTIGAGHSLCDHTYRRLAPSDQS